MNDPLTNLTPSLLTKLGSVVVHIEEFFSTEGKPVDKAAIESLIDDNEIQSWLEEMDKLSLLPKKR